MTLDQVMRGIQEAAKHLPSVIEMLEQDYGLQTDRLVGGVANAEDAALDGDA